MRYIAKEDFLWYKKGHYIPKEEMRDNWLPHVNIEKEEEKKPEVVVDVEMEKPDFLKVEGDLDGDRDFDKDDLKIAGKTLAKGRRKKGKK